MFKKLAAIGALLLMMASFASIVGAAEDAKITLIEVQGNKRIEAATILAKIKTKEGGIFSPAQIKDDIKTLYQMGHFEDVQVKTEGFENGLKVLFLVREKPLLREISFQGNEDLTLEKIKEGLTLLPRTAFNMQLIQENAEKIRLKYQDDGYYNAVIVPIITELKGGDRNVVYYIEENDEVILRDVLITGNHALASKEITKALKSQEHWFFSFLGKSGTLRTEDLREDLETIRNLYYNVGYIQVQVDEPIISLKTYTKTMWIDDEERIVKPEQPVLVTMEDELVVSINVKEGDQFKVGSLVLKGNSTLSDSDLSKELRLKPGDVFSRETLRQDVSRIMDRYDSIARPFANVVPLFNIDAEKKSVAITVEIQEGGEVSIGRIGITGNNKTRDKVIRREMRLDEGELYSKKALKRSYERINNLNYFETVDISPERRLSEPVMDLNVKVKEKLTGTLSIGGGYSSVDKLMAIGEITQGNLNGRGQVLKFKTQWGKTRRIYSLSFMEPYLFDKPIWGKVDLYNQTQDYDGYTLRTNGFGLAVGKSFTEYVSASLRYSYDRSEVANLTASPPFALEKQIDSYGKTISTSAVTASLSRDSRDFYLDPKEGSRNTMFIEYAGGPLGGNPSFIKGVADSAWYFPVVLDTVFMVRGRIGYAGSLIDQPLPMSERYYVGGTGTVRGYQYGSLGPTEPTYQKDGLGNLSLDTNMQPVVTGTNRIGGTKELIYNFEYTIPIVPAARLKAVVFYDIGTAFDHYELIRNRKLRHSYGWGIWWLSPIGPLKFEWGYIINKQPTDQPSLFDFSIGALF